MSGGESRHLRTSSKTVGAADHYSSGPLEIWSLHEPYQPRKTSLFVFVRYNVFILFIFRQS